MKKTSLILCDESRVDHGGFSFVRKRLGAAAGGQKIGASWFELQPGKKAFPFHYHLANEEAVFVSGKAVQDKDHRIALLRRVVAGRQVNCVGPCGRVAERIVGETRTGDLASLNTAELCESRPYWGVKKEQRKSEWQRSIFESHSALSVE